jgi:SNF2 family DNA or RNA helicase
MSFLAHSSIDFKQHQYDGLEWIVQNETRVGDSVVRGGFIADEMGLGKTILMISSFIVNFLPNTLVILPPILIEQWANEIYRTTGHRPLIFHGAANKKKMTAEQLRSAPIVLTTYASVAIVTNNLLHSIKWSRIVFDEAHHLRNKNKRTSGCRLLKADIHWLVSGTPIQNKRKDFYNLCDIVGIDKSIAKDTDQMSQFVLKRTKLQIGIVLPKVLTENVYVPWTNPNEKLLSDNIHNELKFSKHKLPLYGLAVKSCVLPSMLTNLPTNDMLNRVVYSDALRSSSKLDAVISTILLRKDNGSGKLVFCQFRNEIDTVVSRLRSGGIEAVESFDGRDNKKVRSEKLTQSFDVLVIQIKTGCEGLNLQDKYSEVYFVSPHWNPSVEDQAIARCHRIGQQRIVHVFNFEMGSFGPKIVEIVNDSGVDDIDILDAEEEEEDVKVGVDVEAEVEPMDYQIHLMQSKKRRIISEVFPY